MMKRAKGGRTHYGQALGILTLDTKFPRIPGDVGNASTYDFPVRLMKVQGALMSRVISSAKGTDEALLKPFIDAARMLENEGVKAITTTCGFLAVFQEEISNAVNVPVFTSALLQVPMVSSMLGQKRRVGIITADSHALTDRHLKGVGIDQSKINVAIAGMQDTEEFARAILKDATDLDVEQASRDTVGVCKRLLNRHSDIGAFVFEDANLPPYARAVQDETGLPVFDIVSLANLVYFTVVREDFTGFM